LIHLKKSETSF